MGRGRLMRGKLIRVGALLALSLLLFGACSGDEDAGSDGGSGAGMEAPAGGDQDRSADDEVTTQSGAFGAPVSDGDAGTAPQGSSALPDLGPSVIKTGDLSVEVKRGDFAAALQEAESLAGRFGGYVVSTRTSGDRARVGTVVLRIPADDFESALAELKDLGEVGSESVSGKDVSQEFIDLDARLRNLSAQERVLLDLMASAQTVTDTIRVQRELTGVQLEIERIKGRLRYLRDRTQFSTISLSLREEGAAPPPRQNELQKAWERAIDVAFGIAGGVIVATGAVVPIALLALIALGLMRWLRPRFSPPAA